LIGSLLQDVYSIHTHTHIHTSRVSFTAAMNGWRCNAPRVGGTAGALPPPLPESQPAESQHAMPVDCSGSQTVAVPWAPPRPAAARATTMTTAAKFKARPEPRGSQHGAVLAGGRLMYGLSQGASTAPSQATATRGGGGGQEGGPPRGSLPGPWESFPPPSQSQYGWEEQSGKPGGHLNPQVRHAVRLWLMRKRFSPPTRAHTGHATAIPQACWPAASRGCICKRVCISGALLLILVSG